MFEWKGSGDHEKPKYAFNPKQSVKKSPFKAGKEEKKEEIKHVNEKNEIKKPE